MNIDNRIKDIANLIPKCHSIADIGTDHAYLPIYLMQNYICEIAYACDVANGPLNVAKKNIAKYNLNNKIIPILSNGLNNVPIVDVVIMAGMGGQLIIDILKNNSKKYQTFILQPNNNIDTLRKYLCTNNYAIIDEVVSNVNKKYYEILVVINQKQNLTSKEITYGPINLIKKSPNFINKWVKILIQYCTILDNFRGSKQEYQRIIDKIDEIREILQ